jgi:hypothetical protein
MENEGIFKLAEPVPVNIPAYKNLFFIRTTLHSTPNH